MKTTTKIIIGVASVIAVGTIAALLYKNKILAKVPNVPVTKGGATADDVVAADVNANFDPRPHAKKIAYSMAGAGTYADVFFGVYNGLTDAQKTIVNNYFNATQDINGGDSLSAWVEGDFNGWLTSEATYQKAKRLAAY
jgi:hypothetical protein